MLNQYIISILSYIPITNYTKEEKKKNVKNHVYKIYTIPYYIYAKRLTYY